MKNIKKSLRSVFCALLAAAALAASLPAYAVSQAEIDDLQKKLDALEQQAQEQQDVINDLTSQKARFITRKLALDNKIEINRQMIELIGEQIEIYDEIIAEKQAELDKALEKETTQTELLRSRIRAMEENSTYSYASFIFDSSSVTELLSRIGDVNDIMHYDKTLEEEYMAAREDVESIKKSYEEARHEQELLQKELDTKQAELDAQVEAAYTMIADIETLSDDAQAEYDAIAEEEAKAEETLQEAIRKRAAEQAKYNQNNNSNNGGGGNSGGSGGNSGGGGSSGGERSAEDAVEILKGLRDEPFQSSVAGAELHAHYLPLRLPRCADDRREHIPRRSGYRRGHGCVHCGGRRGRRYLRRRERRLRQLRHDRPRQRRRHGVCAYELHRRELRAVCHRRTVCRRGRLDRRFHRPALPL